MLTNPIDFLGILFQLTLFYLLFVLSYRLVKSYLLPMLYAEIEKIKKQKWDMEEKDKLLDESKVRTDKNLKDQKERFLLLEKKVDLWERSLLQQRKDSEKQNHKLLEKVRDKRKKQESNLSLINLQKIVVPSSVQLAYANIRENYGGDKSFGLLKELISVIQPPKK